MRIRSRVGTFAPALVLAALALGGCGKARTPPPIEFGQAPPGPKPVVYAPDLISKDRRFEQFLAFSPRGTDLAFGVTNARWSAFVLYEMTWNGRGWTNPHPAGFTTPGTGGLTAAFTADGKRVFFTGLRPGEDFLCDIWTSTRTDAGWSKPERVPEPVSSDGNEFEVAVAANGTLYFSSTRDGGLGDIDLYRAPLVDGGYPRVENLGAPVNSPSGDDLPWIAPDESRLIFASDRPGTLGFRDLYVTHRVTGGWSEPVHPGPPVNSEYWDIYPSVSPDGKYLFFTRRTEWQAKEDSDILWMDIRALDGWNAE